jgi:hypothetical protein
VDEDVDTVVLVEGESDLAAITTLARRLGRDLAGERVAVVPIGGSKNIRRFLEHYGPRGRDLRVAGLYDAGEEHDFRRGLERAGLGTDLERADLEARGFFVCVADLEDELIRALGVDRVVEVVEAEGELRALRTMQRQPAQRDVSPAAQLRRFMGTRGGRKIRYGTLLVDALDLASVPRPLDLLLQRV